MKGSSFEIYFEKNFRWFTIAIPIIAFFLYSNTISNEYNLDDELVTINHRNTSRGLNAVSDIFNQYYYEDQMGYKYEYRPITHLSFALEHQLFGESPHISHLINCLLYAILCLILYKLLLSFFSQKKALLALIATILFMFHPIHTEVIASIKNRDELLAVLFGICSVLFFKKSFERHAITYVLLSCFFIVLASYSKSSVLPFFMLSISGVLFFVTSKPLVIAYRLVPLLIAFVLGVHFTNIDQINLFFGFLLSILLLKAILSTEIIFLKVSSFYTQLAKINRQKASAILLWFNNIPIIKIPKDDKKNHYALLGLFILLGVLQLIYYNNILGLWIILVVAIVLMMTTEGPINRIISLTIFSVGYLCYVYYEPILFFSNYFLFFLGGIIYWSRTKKFKVGLSVITVMLFIIIEAFELAIGFPINILFILFTFLPENRVSNFVFSSSAILYFLIIYIGIFSDTVRYGFYWELGLACLILATLVYILFKNGINKSKTIILFILPFIMLSEISLNIFVKPILEPKIESTAEVAIDEVSDKLAFDRPLNYIETPVNYDSPMDMKIATSMIIFGKYLQKIIFPHPMGFYYGYAYITPHKFNNFWPWTWGIVFIFLCLLSLYWIIKKQFILAFGIIIFLSGVFQALGIFLPIPGAMGDRFLFQPSIGFSILLAYPFYKAIGTKWQKLAILFFISIISCYGVLIIQRNAQWKNHLTLMRHDIQYLDKSAQAHNLLASNLMKYSFKPEYANEAFSMRQEAIQHFKKAVAIYPDFFNVWYNLGRVYMMLNDLDNAYPCFKKVNEMDSTFITATLNMAMIAESKNNLTDAEKYYKQVIRINPSAKEAYANLSYLYFKENMPFESIKVNEAAIKYSPMWREPYENIARVYLSIKDTANAQRYYNMMPK